MRDVCPVEQPAAQQALPALPARPPARRPRPRFNPQLPGLPQILRLERLVRPLLDVLGLEAPAAAGATQHS